MILKLFLGLALYVILCGAGYIVMDCLYYNKIVTALPNVKQRWLYYLLQFTWGLTMNICGALMAAVLLCCGKRPKRYGWDWCFELNVNGGLSLGIFMIAPVGFCDDLKDHEHGHSIQNMYFGPLFLGMVAIPSVVRFWVREIQYKIGRPPKTDYDEIWFEGQATASGRKFINSI